MQGSSNAPLDDRDASVGDSIVPDGDFVAGPNTPGWPFGLVEPMLRPLGPASLVLRTAGLVWRGRSPLATRA